METNRLKQFCTIVETGSMTRASQLLGITHSGLSKSMTALEAELGLRLFRAEGRGIAVTTEGRAIYRQALDLVAGAEALTRSRTAEESVLRLGVLEIFTSHFSGRLARDYLATGLEILEMGPGQIEASLTADRIDAGLTYAPVPQPGLEHLKFCEIGLGIYARKSCFADTALEDLPFVVPSHPIPTNPLGIKERDGWPDSLFPRRKQFKVNLLSTAMDLTRDGVCAIFIPDFLAKQHNQASSPACQLRALPLPARFPKVRHSVFLVKKVEAAESREMKKLAACVRRLCAD